MALGNTETPASNLNNKPQTPDELDNIMSTDRYLSNSEETNSKSQEYVYIEGSNRDPLLVHSDEDAEFTVEEAVEAMGYGWFQVKVAGIVGFLWMADAFEIMLVSVLSDKLRCEWNLLPYQQALITTFVFGGYFLSAPLWGIMADKYGRKKVIALCSTYIFYFGFLSSFSPNYPWILILRGLVGLSLGGASQSSTLCAEFLPSKNRGVCLIFLNAFWVIGVCGEITLALLVMPTLGWRYLLLFSSAPLIIFIAMLKFLPESPLYQQACGNLAGAMATLKQISKTNKKPLPPGRLKRVINIKPKGSVLELFKTRQLCITFCLLVVIWFCNAFLYYGAVLLTTELVSAGNSCASQAETHPKDTCFAACKSLDASGYRDLLVASFGELPGVLLTLLIIELGRKATMTSEMYLAGIFFFLLSLCLSRNVQVLFFFLVRALVSGAFNGLYVYTPEVYPTHVRSMGLGICVAASRLGAIVTPFVAQVMIKSSVKVTVCVYGAFSLLAGLMSCVLPIETKGRTLK